jgi:hypothetical protein
MAKRRKSDFCSAEETYNSLNKYAKNLNEMAKAGS